MDDPSNELSPYAAAMEWVARITAVGLEMVLPGLAGQWVDRRFGTSFFALLGFAFGLIAGVTHLLAMTGAANRAKSGQGKSNIAGDQGKTNQSEKEGRDDSDG